jgi:SAM-dependent methyltransferase
MATIPYRHNEAVHNKEAAREVLPIVFKTLRPGSVLDVGCGLGTWLTVCEELGVSDLLGVDGEFVNRAKMVIPPSMFRPVDLSVPFNLSRRFDLIICVEVAEHLPESSAADFISSLVRHGDTILFSAAIPGQLGQNHLNEQWPEYWVKQFKQHGYFFHDTIRNEIWDNPKVEWWYRQNIFLVRKGVQPSIERPDLTMIHPELYKRRMADELDYRDSLLKGRQGIVTGMSIFFRSIMFKLGRIFS